MKRITLGLCALCLLVVSCSREQEKNVVTAYYQGNKYDVIDKGDILDQGKPAHFIRYYSDDPFDEAVLEQDRSDILAIVAMHIDTNKHQRVVMTAVERKGPLFGIMKSREVTKSYSAAEVMTYLPEKEDEDE
jgi:hypothetical protein